MKHNRSFSHRRGMRSSRRRYKKYKSSLVHLAHKWNVHSYKQWAASIYDVTTTTTAVSHSGDMLVFTAGSGTGRGVRRY